MGKRKAEGDETVKKTRAYNGPPKGSQQAKDRMQKVREAQWAKNGLSKPEANEVVGEGA